MIEEFKKTKASKLWLSMVVVFVVILNVSFVEAKSLKKGEEFKDKNGGAIRVISSDEVEIEQGPDILLGKYTVDGERVRIVVNAGATEVFYYKITPDGLVEEKSGTVFYSKAGLVSVKEEMKRAEEEEKRFAALPAAIRVPSPVLPEAIASFIGSRGLSLPASISKFCRFDFKKDGNPFFIAGDFDGDGKLDYAIDVQDEKNSNIFVFLATGQIHQLDGWEYIYTDKRRGTIATYDGDVNLKYDSIGGVRCESSSSVYVYNETKKRFIRLVTSD